MCPVVPLVGCGESNRYIYSGLRWVTSDGVNILLGDSGRVCQQAGEVALTRVLVTARAMDLCRLVPCADCLGTGSVQASSKPSFGECRHPALHACGCVCLLMRMLHALSHQPPWIVVLLIPTKRVHSIFMLRLFNDGIATLIMFAAILVFAKRKVALGGR